MERKPQVRRLGSSSFGREAFGSGLDLSRLVNFSNNVLLLLSSEVKEREREKIKMVTSWNSFCVSLARLASGTKFFQSPKVLLAQHLTQHPRASETQIIPFTFPELAE